METIRIVHTLPVGTPDYVRVAWIGLELPYIETEHMHQVSLNDAVAAFHRQGRLSAARFWSKIGGPIGFPKKLCEVKMLPWTLPV